MNSSVAISVEEVLGCIGEVPMGMSLDYFPSSVRGMGGKQASVLVYYNTGGMSDYSHKDTNYKGLKISVGSGTRRLSSIIFNDDLLNEYLDHFGEYIDFLCKDSNIPFVGLHYKMIFKLLKKYDKRLFLLAQ
jgi:hypothetical protein